MARRCKDWNEDRAESLLYPSQAQAYLAAAIADGMSIQQAIGKLIRAVGVKEFSDTVNIPSSNLLRAIHSRHNPTQETLNRLLEPFGLQIGLAVIQRRKDRVR